MTVVIRKQTKVSKLIVLKKILEREDTLKDLGEGLDIQFILEATYKFYCRDKKIPFILSEEAVLGLSCFYTTYNFLSLM